MEEDVKKLRAKRGPRKLQPIEATTHHDTLLPLRTFSEFIGDSIPTIYRKWSEPEKYPDYPQRIKLGSRCVRIRAGDAIRYSRSLVPVQVPTKGPVT